MLEISKYRLKSAELEFGATIRTSIFSSNYGTQSADQKRRENFYTGMCFVS